MKTTGLVMTVTLLMVMQGCREILGPLAPLCDVLVQLGIIQSCDDGAPSTPPPPELVACRPDRLVLEHGEGGTMTIIISQGYGLGVSGSYTVDRVEGPPADPTGQEIAVSPAPGESNSYDHIAEIPIQVRSLNRDPPPRTNDYRIFVKFIETGLPAEENPRARCDVSVVHTDLTPAASQSWVPYCDPNPLELVAGESGEIKLLTSGSGEPDTFSITSVRGLDNDVEAKNISYSTNAPPDMSGEPGDFWFFEPSTLEIVTKVLNDPQPSTERYWIFISAFTDVTIEITCGVHVFHIGRPPPEEPAPTPTPTVPPKFILTGISVTHEIRQGQVHFWVHVRDQAYDGQIWGKEIFFDGVLVERFMYDFWILPHCQPSEVDIPYQGNPPEVIEIHFLRRDGSNLGSVFSQPASTGMGKSVPGVGGPPAPPGCA